MFTRGALLVSPSVLMTNGDGQPLTAIIEVLNVSSQIAHLLPVAARITGQSCDLKGLSEVTMRWAKWSCCALSHP